VLGAAHLSFVEIDLDAFDKPDFPRGALVLAIQAVCAIYSLLNSLLTHFVD